MANHSGPLYISDGDAPAKQKILAASLQLFVRDGLCETSIRDIASASGFTNPALFKHFAGKDALAEYLFERCYLHLFRVVAGAIESGGPFAEKQQKVIEAYMTALHRDQNAVLYVQDNLRHFWPKMPLHVRRNSISCAVRALLEAGRSEGSVTTSVAVDLLAVAWLGTLQQFARQQYFGGFKQSRKAITKALGDLLTRMVRP